MVPEQDLAEDARHAAQLENERDYNIAWNRFPPPGSKRVVTGIRLLADSPNAGLRAGIGVSVPGRGGIGPW